MMCKRMQMIKRISHWSVCQLSPSSETYLTDESFINWSCPSRLTLMHVNQTFRNFKVLAMDSGNYFGASKQAFYEIEMKWNIILHIVFVLYLLDFFNILTWNVQVRGKKKWDCVIWATDCHKTVKINELIPRQS